MSTQTQPQHLAALQRGNAIRYARSELRRRVQAGELNLAELLRGDHDDVVLTVDGGIVTAHDAIAKTKVANLLTWERYVGQRRAARTMLDAGITQRVRIIDLNASRREVVAHALTLNLDPRTKVA